LSLGLWTSVYRPKLYTVFRYFLIILTQHPDENYATSNESAINNAGLCRSSSTYSDCICIVFQTACPAFFLHTPALASYLMMYMGITSNNAIVYCSGILWMLYPVSSPLITIGFMKEYRTFFLKKIGLGVVSSKNGKNLFASCTPLVLIGLSGVFGSVQGAH
uniref:G protein-coupled receptor n=1 Tax=Heligmosomoides polygyrus TaxID=6339 RepID=A0A183F205_HELPZ